MMYILGIITGLAIATLLLLIETYLVPRKKGIIQIIERETQRLKPKAKVFFPKTEEEVAQDSVISGHERKGEGTPLTEL